MATNVAKPTSANLPNLSAIPVPVDYSQPTGLALMLADMIVSGRKVVSYLRQISTANFISGAYSFPTPPDYTPAPYQLPMLEPVSWNVVADIVTAYQPVEVYQIGSTTDLMQSTFPIIINPTDYTSDTGAIKPLDVGQSVVIRAYKVASAGINWAGSNIVNNGLTDEAIKSLTQITMVVTNVAGVYTVTDWIGVDFITNGMSNLKTSAKGNFAAVINELFDSLATKASGATIGGAGVTKTAEGVLQFPAYPAKLPTPFGLTFTGGKTGSFDGSSANTVPVPYAWAQADTKPAYTASEVGALPTAGGTMTGDITLGRNGGSIIDVLGRKIITGYSTPYLDIGNSDVEVAIRSSATDARHIAGGTAYKMWDARNSNLSTVDWSAKVVTAADRVNSTNGFFQTSDERLKEFLGEMVIDWEALNKLPKSFYRLKNDPEHRIQIGTSAQALKEVFPELVSVGTDGYYSVDYARLSVVALSAACELQDRVTSIEERLARLEAKLAR